MSHDLCPDVRIGEILKQTRQATRVLAERAGQAVVVSGHSAGGHLAACLLATEAQVKAAYAISGVFDLRELLGTPLNTALRLAEDSARELSPVLWTAPSGKPLDAVVGGLETDGFKRQTAAMAAAWERQGALVRSSEIPNTHHLNVIAGLADPNSPMCRRILEMVNAN